MRLNDGMIDVVGKQFESNVLLEGGTGIPNEAPLAGNRFDDVLALELRVRFGDGVAIDAQVFGKRAGSTAAGLLPRERRKPERLWPDRRAGGRRAFLT